MNLGKLRGSYGVTGNDQVGGGTNYFSSWAPTAYSAHPLEPSVMRHNMLSPAVSWETIHKLEVGMDLGFWENRAMLSVSLYRNWSSNQLVADSLPKRNQSTVLLNNEPIVVQNSGWEFTLSTDNVETRQFSWSTAFNLSLPRNRLVAFPNAQRSFIGKQLIVGQPLSALRGYQYIGVDPQTGTYQFAHQSSTIQPSDQQWVGQPGIRCFGGMENTFRWRQWQVSLFVEGRIQQGANYMGALLANNVPGAYAGSYSNLPTALLDRWRQPGDKSLYQRMSAGNSDAVWNAQNYYIGSSAMLVNASFMRLKSMVISYELPEGLLKKMGCKEAKMSLQGQNLFTITPYKDVDPEIQSIMILPPMRNIQLSIQARF